MLHNQKVIQNFFWKDEYKYLVLETAQHGNIQASPTPFLFIHIIRDFFIHHFHQKYMCMQIQYKSNCAK